MLHDEFLQRIHHHRSDLLPCHLYPFLQVRRSLKYLATAVRAPVSVPTKFSACRLKNVSVSFLAVVAALQVRATRSWVKEDAFIFYLDNKCRDETTFKSFIQLKFINTSVVLHSPNFWSLFLASTSNTLFRLPVLSLKLSFTKATQTKFGNPRSAPPFRRGGASVRYTVNIIGKTLMFVPALTMGISTYTQNNIVANNVRAALLQHWGNKCIYSYLCRKKKIFKVQNRTSKVGISITASDINFRR